MGKATGFMEYERVGNAEIPPLERIKNYNEFHLPLSEEERREQASRCMNCGVPFCQSGELFNGMVSGCPLHNMCPEFNDSLYLGFYDQALSRLLRTNNFPEFTSRVCPAPCEVACTCGLNDTSVTIKENENAIIEYGYAHGYMDAKVPSVRTGKKIAVVGSGPSGLACADQLNKRGHSVTVFERNSRPGGLLMYGIPNMKLEKSIVERKVTVMEEEGVEFRCGCDVGKDIKSKDLLKEFDRVILTCGASHPRDIKAPGREAKGIYFAVDYLTGVTKHLLGDKDADFVDAKGKNVVVIGGGDTGNDCVGSAIRQGAKSVIQLEMMPKPPVERLESNPWPEWPKVLKTDYGQQEAIAVFGEDPRIYETTVKEFHKDSKGNLKEIVTVDLSWEKDPKTGRMQMQIVKGSEKVRKAEIVLIAAGFLGSEDYVKKAFDIEETERTNIKTLERSYETTKKGVFAAGDCRRGQSLVVWAIYEGRQVAKEVDKDLMGYTNLI